LEQKKLFRNQDATKRKKPAFFLLKVGWILMFAGTPLGSGIAAFPFLLVGRLLRGGFRIKKDAFFLLTNVFLFASLISIVNAQNKLVFLGSAITLALMLYLVLLGARYIIPRRGFLTKLVKVFILCSVISSIYGLVVYFGGFGERARAIFSGENGLGTVMIPAVIGTLAFFTHTSDKQKLLAGLALPILLLGLLFSLSRGAWLGAIGGLLIYGFYQRRDRLKVALLIIIMIIALFAYPPLFYRLSSIPDLSYASNQERIYILEATWEMIKDYPLVGIGMGNYPLVYPKYKVKESKIFDASFAHNIFLQIWAEAGIGALVAFIGIVALVIVKGVRIAKNCYDPFLRVTGATTFASFAGILIHNQMDCTVYSLHIGSFFLLLAGIIFYGEKLCQAKANKNFEQM